jgi:integrase
LEAGCVDALVLQPPAEGHGGTRCGFGGTAALRRLRSSNYLFPGKGAERHLSVRQYSRLVKSWAGCIGLNQSRYGTHYKRTKNIRAIQLLLGHAKLESTVRYLGIELDDAIAISEQTEI